MKTPSDFASYAASSRGQKILLVDDVPQGTIARKSVLQSLGYEVETAESGAEALAKMAIHGFDLMVTDYQMPGMDGIELIGRVKAHDGVIRIVLLAKMADTLGLTEESTGAHAVITKSSTELTQLTRTIKKLLTKKPARKPARSEKAEPRFMVKSS
jgi:CheY-like chemotaxis protein